MATVNLATTVLVTVFNIYKKCNKSGIADNLMPLNIDGVTTELLNAGNHLDYTSLDVDSVCRIRYDEASRLLTTNKKNITYGTLP